MPIYMDRHDVSESVTAENVAELHQRDLKFQHQFGCRGLTYWFDEVRNTAFCLIEAPNKAKITEMHNYAHGQVPHQIIEVEPSIVESFLGRIEDPAKALDSSLNIINDPAFRTIMIVTIENHWFKSVEPLLHAEKMQNAYKQMIEVFYAFEGNVVKQSGSGFLISFQSVTKAIACALKILDDFNNFKNQNQIEFTELGVGLHAGSAVTQKDTLFEEVIKLAERMHFISRAKIVVSTEVYHLFRCENLAGEFNGNPIYVLSPLEERFIGAFMGFTEKEWQNTSLKINDIVENIGISKSKLYRTMIRLTGKSPNAFLLYYRLHRSLQRLQGHQENIAEVAYNSGFNSPSYFSKCFRKQYGIMPSKLVNSGNQKYFRF